MEVFLRGAIVALVIGVAAFMASVYSKVDESKGETPPFRARMKWCGLFILFIVIFPVTLIMWIVYLIKKGISKKKGVQSPKDDEPSKEDKDN